MKIKKKLYQKYNQTASLAVVSLYPEKGEVYSPGTTGVASYTKNLVTSLDRPVVIFAGYKDRPRVYEEDNGLVIRCFKPGRIGMWREIIKSLRRFTQIKKVLVQFDFAMYGGILTSSLVIPFLLWLRLLGFQPYLVTHSVILDVNKLSGHVGLGKGFKDKIKAWFYNLSFYLFYAFLGLLVRKVIVLEEPLRKRLAKVIRGEKIVAIPHAVDTSLKPMVKSKARKELGIGQNEAVVMFFGFVNWFKGADIFASTFKRKQKLLGKKARFIIAGGVSPTLSEKSYYQKYFTQVQQMADNSRNVEITGCLPQEKIAAYFSAADLVVFPYRYFMCASGVLSLAFSYKKPFIVSEKLSSMLKASDFASIFKEVGLDMEKITFSLEGQDFVKTTERVLRNGVKPKLIKIAKINREKRSFKETALVYEQALFTPAFSYRPRLTFLKPVWLENRKKK